MFRALFLAAMLIASPALADNQPRYQLSEIKHDPRTPKQFLFMFQGRFKDIPVRSEAEVRKLCNGFNPDQPIMFVDSKRDLGCSFTHDDGRCTVVFMVGKPHVWWHEVAHCNGFVHD